MNTLALIKEKIQKAAKLHESRLHIAKYRGVECEVHQGSKETHGTFCYRGRTYHK